MGGHKILADGSCSKHKTVTYKLKQRDVDITSEGLISLQVQTGFIKGQNICLTSLTRAKCGTRSTLCWKNPNISGSIKLFAL